VVTVLGIGLSVPRIEMLKSGAEPLRDFIIRTGIIAEAARYPLVLLLLGAAITVVSQSSTVTGAIAVTAANIGGVDFSSACLLVYGANLGSGVNHIFLARSLKGDGRQIALMQTRRSSSASARSWCCWRPNGSPDTRSWSRPPRRPRAPFPGRWPGCSCSIRPRAPRSARSSWRD